MHLLTDTWNISDFFYYKLCCTSEYVMPETTHEMAKYLVHFCLLIADFSPIASLVFNYNNGDNKRLDLLEDSKIIELWFLLRTLHVLWGQSIFATEALRHTTCHLPHTALPLKPWGVRHFILHSAVALGQSAIQTQFLLSKGLQSRRDITEVNKRTRISDGDMWREENITR